MNVRKASIFTCLLATLFFSGLGFAGRCVSPANNAHDAFDEELFEAASVPNKWTYILQEPPSLSNCGLTFTLYTNILLPDVRTASFDEAEALFCETYPIFLEKLNALRGIRPLLASFPLDPDSCQLNIMFIDEHGDPIRPPLLAGVSLNRGVLEFYRGIMYTSEDSTPYKMICKRKARDVLGLKNYYQPKCPRSRASASTRKIHFLRSFWAYNTTFFQEEIETLKKLCLQENLSITTIGSVGRSPFDIRPLDFALHGSQQLNLEKARSLAKTCLQRAFAYIQNSTAYKEVIEKWISSPQYHPSSTPSSDQIAFRINFWDENIDRPVAPYIAEIRLLDDKLSYFTADENQCLVLTFEETV